MASSHYRPRGFALALTLWILAAIAVVVGLVTLWALQSVRDAGADRARIEDMVAMHGTRDTLLYLGATRALTRAGLPVTVLSDDARARRLLDDFGALDTTPRGGEIRMDGRPYLGDGNARFAIQDEAGLFSLVLPAAAGLDRVLAATGVPQREVPAYRDALLDYTDADSLKRLAGAEAREYEFAHLPPPPDRQLLLPSEAVHVLGWDSPPSQLRTLLSESTTFESGTIGINTMPAALLPFWLPGCPETCRAFIERRDRAPFMSARDAELALGISLPGDAVTDYRTLPSETWRLTLWGRSGAAERIHVRFTPLADATAPWSILAAYPVSRPDENATAQPTGSALFPDPDPRRR